MNYSTALFLVRSDVRAVAVSYEVDAEGKGKRPFVTFKTMDPSIAVGQYVVIPTGTRHDMTVVRVEEVDVEVDLDSTVQINWIVGPVDVAPYEAIISAENEAIAAIKSAETRRKKEELAAKLVADNPDLQRLKEFGAPSALAPPLEG